LSGVPGRVNLGWVTLSNCTLENGTPRFTYRKPFDILAEGVKTKEWLATLDRYRTFFLHPPLETRDVVNSLNTLIPPFDVAASLSD
jgi:hypothetical protein